MINKIKESLMKLWDFDEKLIYAWFDLYVNEDRFDKEDKNESK